MRVIVESVGNEIVSDFCFKGWEGANMFNHVVTKVDIKNLYSVSDLQNCIPIGSIEYIKKVAEILDIKVHPPLNIPDIFRDNVSRDFFVIDKAENIPYPCFVKPLNDVKLFPGFVAKSIKDFRLYPETIDWDGPYFCSDIIKDILSEWRVFVYKNVIINVSNYAGDPVIFPDIELLHTWVDCYRYKAPIAYTLDIACVASKEYSVIIELNDMWAIGPYGCPSSTYFSMLKDRWLQIVKNQ